MLPGDLEACGLQEPLPGPMESDCLMRPPALWGPDLMTQPCLCSGPLLPPTPSSAHTMMTPHLLPLLPVSRSTCCSVGCLMLRVSP